MKYREPKKSELRAEMKTMRVQLADAEREIIRLRSLVETWQTAAAVIIVAAIIALVLMAVRSAA